jgi:hypothetical protein
MNAHYVRMTGWYGRRSFAYRCAVATFRCVPAVVALAALLACAPSYAVTSKDKTATCKFGADDQHLQGKARSAFMKKCTSNKDEPRGTGSAPATIPAQH